MKKYLAVLLILGFFCPLVSQAAALKVSYPRLANYFLKWEISDSEAKDLAKWDLLILDMEVQENSREQLKKIRQLNPNIIILAYITSQEIISDIDDYNSAYLRQELFQHISPGWWIKDGSGRRVSNWPGTDMLNLTDGALPNGAGQRFNDYLPEFVAAKIQSTGLWDGVFYDNTWGDVAWVNGANLDLDNNGSADNPNEANNMWSAGFKKMLEKTRRLSGSEFIIVGNGRVYEGYQKLLNGMMLENFPSTWENGGTWAGSLNTYMRLATLNKTPNLSIINVLDKNQNNYRHFRFGLASALLGNGLYGFDYDISNHGQIWWYDEYDINLGPAKSRPYNLLDSSLDFKPGLWRRDFKYGTAVVNSTNKEQRYVFPMEEFNKIKGEQDPLINSGLKINYLKLAPQDGIILLKRDTIIKDSAFTNGYFYRIFNLAGEQVNNGFFSYFGAFPGSNEVIVAANGDSQEVNATAGAGQISLYKNGDRVSNFHPYGRAYQGPLNFSAQISDGYFRFLAVGAGQGGGPQVSLFNFDGQLKGNFFAYDKKLRGGVNLALGDIDGDGQLDLVTGPGQGSEPRVKIFDLKGKLKNSWLAYDQKFLGGVSIALGDVDGDGQLEIITGAGQGGGPQVRIFRSSGEVIKSFFAYDKNFHGGIRVSAYDANEDGLTEILVGIRNFY